MSELIDLLLEEGAAAVLLIALIPGIAYVVKWFLTSYTTRVDRKYAELLREIAEIKIEVINSNNKLYSINEKLISNQREIGEDINALESSLDTLLKFINKNGSK